MIMATLIEVWNAQNVVVQATSVTDAATVVTALIAGYFDTLHKLIKKEHWKLVIGLLGNLRLQ